MKTLATVRVGRILGGELGRGGGEGTEKEREEEEAKEEMVMVSHGVCVHVWRGC